MKVCSLSRSLLAIVFVSSCFMARLAAQSGSSSAVSQQPVLNEQQQAGRGLFLQNCSYCHLPTKENNKSTAEGTTVGPLLKGLMQGSKPRPEAVVRGFILKGTAKMPGFQYAFQPKEMDQIIAYLKTL
ncbi:MAG: cytochrome c [Acidobacteria bacterium]|nr:cytochrome c [Acidobacteriota bacterium]